MERAVLRAGAGARVGPRLAWAAWVTCVALILSGLVLDRLTPGFLLPPERPPTLLAVSTALLSLACPTVGALVASRLPANPIGWIFWGVGLLYGARRLASAYADQALLARPWLPMGEYAAWTSTWLGFPILMAAGVFLALLFPEERLAAPVPRGVAGAAAGGAAAVCLADALRFGPLRAYYYATNPLGLSGEVGPVPVRSLLEALGVFGWASLSAACAASVVSLLLRLRRARGDGRQQLGWFACGAVPALLGAAVMLLDRAVAGATSLLLEAPFRPALRAAGELGVFVREGRALGPLAELRLETTFELLAVLALFTVPMFTGVAVLRHRLYDIDLVINRALVYGALTAAVVSSYVLVVAGFGALLHARGNLFLALVATGAIATLFQPLRARLQRGVDRLMYGQRRDPYAALAGLGERLEATLAPEAVLPAVVETVALAMKVPYAAITLKREDGPETVAAHGSPVGDPTTIPLRRGEDLVGWLTLSPRRTNPSPPPTTASSRTSPARPGPPSTPWG